MRLYMNGGCQFVKGKCRAAIYDFNTGKVFSLNNIGKKIVDSALNDEIFPNEIELDYLKKLIGLSLLKEKPASVSNDNGKSAFIKPRLKYVWLELTQLCNLQCIHCYGQWGQTHTVSNSTLNLRMWKNIIDQICKKNCDEIQLIGGEPTLFNGFIEILEYAKMTGIKRIDIFTNATMLDEKSIDVIKKVGASIRVSLYGHNAETHEKITQMPGSFKKTKQILKMLYQKNIPTTISVILMRENQDYLKCIENFITSLGHKYNGYDTIRKISDSILDEHFLTKEEIIEQRYQTKPIFQTSMFEFSKNLKWNSCWFGKLAITSTGDVIPCIFARNFITGNIKKESLNDIINKKLISYWAITKDKIDVCSHCEYRYACHDCRPLSFGLCNNIYAKYPRCCYDPFNGEWKSVKDVTFEIKNQN